MSSGSQESGCSPGRGWGGVGILVSPWSEEGVCAAEVWFALEGWNEGGADNAVTHTHTHSKGSDALQIRTSRLHCPTRSSELGLFSFFFVPLWKWVCVQLAAEASQQSFPGIWI